MMMTRLAARIALVAVAASAGLASPAHAANITLGDMRQTQLKAWEKKAAAIEAELAGKKLAPGSASATAAGASAPATPSAAVQPSPVTERTGLVRVPRTAIPGDRAAISPPEQRGPASGMGGSAPVGRPPASLAPVMVELDLPRAQGFVRRGDSVRVEFAVGRDVVYASPGQPIAGTPWSFDAIESGTIRLSKPVVRERGLPVECLGEDRDAATPKESRRSKRSNDQIFARCESRQAAIGGNEREIRLISMSAR